MIPECLIGTHVFDDLIEISVSSLVISGTSVSYKCRINGSNDNRRRVYDEQCHGGRFPVGATVYDRIDINVGVQLERNACSAPRHELYQSLSPHLPCGLPVEMTPEAGPLTVAPCDLPEQYRRIDGARAGGLAELRGFPMPGCKESKRSGTALG